MSAFLALGFSLFAAGWTFLILFFGVLVVGGKSRASEKGERASGYAQEFDEFHSFDL